MVQGLPASSVNDEHRQKHLRVSSGRKHNRYCLRMRWDVRRQKTGPCAAHGRHQTCGKASGAMRIVSREVERTHAALRRFEEIRQGTSHGPQDGSVQDHGRRSLRRGRWSALEATLGHTGCAFSKATNCVRWRQLAEHSRRNLSLFTHAITRILGLPRSLAHRQL